MLTDTYSLHTFHPFVSLQYKIVAPFIPKQSLYLCDKKKEENFKFEMFEIDLFVKQGLIIL